VTTPYHRYVAIGDSTTEGLDDPYPDGSGYRGWADRLAGELARLAPDLLYANLAIRGRLAHQVHAEQLEPALALAPDVATVVAGLNDALRRGFDLDATAGHLDAMITRLRESGATVVTFTFPDPAPVMPIARLARPRLQALNARLRATAERTGALVLDLERHPFASDPRLWSVDRLHANSLGHARIAAGLARTLTLPDADPVWDEPLPALPSRGVHTLIGAELAWSGRYFVPWLIRRARGRSSGDGVTAKRPDLAPFVTE
jgi:lysophospholipase L1-like esterase